MVLKFREEKRAFVKVGRHVDFFPLKTLARSCGSQRPRRWAVLARVRGLRVGHARCSAGAQACSAQVVGG